MTVPLSGRRARAARNDVQILAAARDVFVVDPDAPVSAVAERAGVGISALYRRYRSKEDMLRKLCADGLELYVAAAEEALARAGTDGPWDAFGGFMRRVVDADTHSLTVALAGTFTPTEELYHLATRAGTLNRRLVDIVKESGALRTDIDVADLGLIFEQLAAVRLGDARRTEQLRHRYLALILDALRAEANHGPLPGPAPSQEELGRRWAR